MGFHLQSDSGDLKMILDHQSRISRTIYTNNYFVRPKFNASNLSFCLFIFYCVIRWFKFDEYTFSSAEFSTNITGCRHIHHPPISMYQNGKLTMLSTIKHVKILWKLRHSRLTLIAFVFAASQRSHWIVRYLPCELAVYSFQNSSVSMQSHERKWMMGLGFSRKRLSGGKVCKIGRRCY